MTEDSIEVTAGDDAAVGMSRVVEPVGLFDVPRSFDDLWLTPRLWTLGKAVFIVVAFMTAAINPTLLEALLLSASGLGLRRLLRDPSPILLLAPLEGADSAVRELAVLDLRDQIESEGTYVRDLKTAGLLSLPTVYFSLGSAITLGFLGSNSLGLSPVPWITGVLFTSVPMLGHAARGLRKWWNRRKHSRILDELTQPNQDKGAGG